MKIVTYLTFAGNCREAFARYEEVLGGKIVFMSSFEGTPAAEHVAPDWRDRIMHACLAVGDQMIMGTDAPADFRRERTGFSVSLQLDSRKEAERIFNALGEGGEIKMPFEETFWAERFGALVDRFGTPWMVNYEGGTRFA